MIEVAHLRGIRVIGCTLTPFGGSSAYSERGEAMRQAVNDWIRTSGAFDAVVDFDAVTRDAKDPQRFRPEAESPDLLHPGARRKQALYGELKKYLDGKVLSLSYRYMTDDWGIDSNTVEAKLRWPFATGMYVEPTLRFYTQTAADFYRLSLPLGQPLPQFASADYRLSDFNGTTVGLKFGRELSSGQQWSARLEYYQQTGNAPAALLIGNQANRDQTPGLKAVIAQFTYRFGF